MKQKINLLIAFSAVVLVGLIVIQYYLVKTAYDYKVEELRIEIKNKLAEISNDYSDIDSTVFLKKDIFYNQLVQKYLNGKTHKWQMKSELLQQDFNAEITKKLKSKIENHFPEYELNFAVVLDKFIIYNEEEKDTIFAEKPVIENKIYGDLASLNNAFLIRNYVSTTSNISTEKSNYKLLTEDTLFISIQNWKGIIWDRMFLIFVFSILSIILIISLFYISIKSLLKSKKVSDIKTDFINNITHELKTPLTTLAVTTKILNKPEIINNKEAHQKIIETINRQNQRLQNLIDQVMTNSLGFEEIELHKEKIDAHLFLEQLIHDFQLAYPNIKIQNEFYYKNVKLHLDKFHLTTALNNVLENAVKYGSKNISVVTRLENDQFMIGIQDDGIGIPKKNQSMLFDKFYRVQKNNIHDTKGLGLGLFYVDQIVKAHQGTIKVISELGNGSTFKIEFPTI